MKFLNHIKAFWCYHVHVWLPARIGTTHTGWYCQKCDCLTHITSNQEVPQ